MASGGLEATEASAARTIFGRQPATLQRSICRRSDEATLQRSICRRSDEASSLPPS
jgi:hypothetical protein